MMLEVPTAPKKLKRECKLQLKWQNHEVQYHQVGENLHSHIVTVVGLISMLDIGEKVKDTFDCFQTSRDKVASGSKSLAMLYPTISHKEAVTQAKVCLQILWQNLNSSFLIADYLHTLLQPCSVLARRLKCLALNFHFTDPIIKMSKESPFFYLVWWRHWWKELCCSCTMVG